MNSRLILMMLVLLFFSILCPAGIEALSMSDLDQFIGYTTPEPIYNPETGEVLIPGGTVVTEEMIQSLIEMDYINRFLPYHVSVTGVSMSKSSVEMIEGSSDILYANIKPSEATFKIVKWASSDPGVVQVSERRDLSNASNASAQIKAVSAGTATITVTTIDGNKRASCQVRVLLPVSSVMIIPNEAIIKPGDFLRIQAMVQPSQHTNPAITWESTDAAVASVDAVGYVTARKEGESRIIARSVQDESVAAFCTVIVSAAAEIEKDVNQQEDYSNEITAEDNEIDNNNGPDYLLIVLIGIVVIALLLIVITFVVRR